MSSDTIEKLTVTVPENNPDVVRVREDHYSSNCFDAEGRHARAVSTWDFSRHDEEGALAYYLHAKSEASAFDGGCLKGLGMNNLTGLQCFTRIARRVKKYDIEVPMIVDPAAVLWVERSFGEDAVESPLDMLGRAMEKAVAERSKPEVKELKDLSQKGISEWMKKNGFYKVRAKVKCHEVVWGSHSKELTERTMRFIFIKGENSAYPMVKRRNAYLHAWPDIKELKQVEVLRRL